MARNKTLTSKITLSTFRPKRFLAEPESVNKMLLGTLIGRATKVVRRNGPDGETAFEGLGGVFEASVIGDEAPINSGVLYMQESFINPLIDLISDEVDSKTGEVTKAGASAALIAYKVYVVRSKNPAGYSWELEAISDPKAEEPVDELAALRGFVSAPVQAQIEAPKPAAGKAK